MTGMRQRGHRGPGLEARLRVPAEVGRRAVGAPSDDELLRRARDGDREALGRLYCRVDADVRRSLDINPKWRSVLTDDDVMQVTYLEATQDIRSGPTTAASFRHWLRRVAQNNLRDAIEALRRRKRPQPGDRVEGGDDPVMWLYNYVTTGVTTPSVRASRAELRAILRQEIELLPGDYARVIRLRFFHGLPVPRIAAEMSRNDGAVFMLLRRALDRLADRMRGGGDSTYFI